MTLYLYRKWRLAVTLAVGLAVTLAAIVGLSPGLDAQVFRAPQRERTAPRAVGVLETGPNGTRRLIPVSFFYERRYYDAILYRATPVPFTLDSETVYEVQQFGKALGSFTVQSATRSGEAWFGNGHYKLVPDASLLAMKKAKAVPAAVVEDSSRPVLHRRAGSEGDHPVPHAAGETSAITSANTGTTPGNDDPDRPVLHRKEGADGDAATAQAGTPASARQSQTTPGKDADHPVLHRREEAEPDASQASTDHPILRRGKPVEEQSGGDLPELDVKSRPDARDAEPVTRQVAVSDAEESEPQDLIFVCPQEKREQMEAQARELAEAELRAVAAKRGLPEPSKSEAKPASAKSGTSPSLARRKSAADSEPQTLLKVAPQEEQFVPYDLDYSDYATVVYSARYRPEAASDGSTAKDAAPAAGVGLGNAALPAAGASAMGGWVVTVIARQDEDKLVKLYSAVSDPRELDLYPEVRLVDAVDPDGYGRDALLFREQKRDGVSWLLGRVTGYEMQTLFETAER